jgi:ERCC4-type nuclease
VILIDPRDGNDGQRRTANEFLSRLRARQIPASLERLAFGDFAFEGQGPEGSIGVGIERKTLHDMLTCIDDHRYTGHQRVGMAKMYQVSVLMLEGQWRPHDPDGYLMEGFGSNGSTRWGSASHHRKPLSYSKLRRYLFSIALSGVIVIYTRDVAHSAADVAEVYHYFQKAWKDHTTLLEMPKLHLPSLTGTPSTTRQWAACLDGIGLKHSERAEKQFRTPLALATAEEQDWLKLPGIGVPTARKIVKQIKGEK